MNTEKTYNPFKEKFSQLENTDLLKIIENGDQYQEEAIAAALKIAKERGLLNNEIKSKLKQKLYKDFGKEIGEWRNKKIVSIYKFSGLIGIIFIFIGILGINDIVRINGVFYFGFGILSISLYFLKILFRKSKVKRIILYSNGLFIESSSSIYYEYCEIESFKINHKRYYSEDAYGNKSYHNSTNEYILETNDNKVFILDDYIKNLHELASLIENKIFEEKYPKYFRTIWKDKKPLDFNDIIISIEGFFPLHDYSIDDVIPWDRVFGTEIKSGEIYIYYYSENEKPIQYVFPVSDTKNLQILIRLFSLLTGEETKYAQNEN